MSMHNNLTSLNELIHQLGKGTELGIKMFYYLIDRGFLDIDRIEIDPIIDRSAANASLRGIVLGTAPISTEERDRLVFEGASQEDVNRHVFSHEMAHIFIRSTEECPSTRALVSMTSDVRRGSYYERGLSVIGSQGHYDRHRRWEEDAAELIALRLRSAAHLSRFVLSLTRTDQASLDERDKFGLVSLTEESAAKAEAIVNSAVALMSDQK